MSDHAEAYRLDRRPLGERLRGLPSPSYGRFDDSLPRFRVGQSVRIGSARGLRGTVVYLGEHSVVVEWECGELVRGTFEFHQIVAA